MVTIIYKNFKLSANGCKDIQQMKKHLNQENLLKPSKDSEYQ